MISQSFRNFDIYVKQLHDKLRHKEKLKINWIKSATTNDHKIYTIWRITLFNTIWRMFCGNFLENLSLKILFIYWSSKFPVLTSMNFRASAFEFKFGTNFCKVTDNFRKIFFEYGYWFFLAEFWYEKKTLCKNSSHIINLLNASIALI